MGYLLDWYAHVSALPQQVIVTKKPQGIMIYMIRVPKVRENHIFKGHGKGREFYIWSGKSENLMKCQGQVREFCSAL